MTRRQRLALVAALYCTQNLSLGFYTYAFLTIAQSRGVGLGAIGAATGVGTVLVAKFLWAPLVDRFGSSRLGHYRGWLVITQSVIGLGVLSLALFDPGEQFGPMVAVFAVIFVAAGTQDIAADATATRLLKEGDRGIGNGIQSAGSCVAQVVGGGVVLLVHQAAGWQVAAIVLAALSLVALPFILAWREDDATGPAAVRPRVTLRSAFGVFARSEVRWWCLLLIPLYTAGSTVAYNLVRPILVDAGWDEGRIGLYVVIAGSGVGLVAGIAAGALISAVGRRRSLIALGVPQVLATAATIILAEGATSPGIVLAVVGLSTAAFTASAAIVYTIVMGLARPESAGTDFTWLTTVTNIAMVAAAGVGLSLAGQFGFTRVLIVATGLAVAGVLAVVLIAPTAAEPDRAEAQDDDRTAASASTSPAP